jgi:hypothetical protein
MKKKLAIAALGGALAFGLTAAVNATGPGQAGARQAQVGRVVALFPSDPPIIRG